MDLTVIRIKRFRESEPLDQISLSSKKFKDDDGHPIISKIATLESKDAPLSSVFKNAVSKLKQEKLFRQHQKSVSYQELYKTKSEFSKRHRNRLLGAEKQRETAYNSRLEITNKARGITDVDDDTLKYLSKSEQFSIKLKTETKESVKDVSIQDTKTEVEVIDVKHSSSSKEDDVICVNGVPMEEVESRYVYDIYIAARPKGILDDLDIIEPPILYDDYDACDEDVDYDSEDSNAENYYTNDYPDEEDEHDDGRHQKEEEYHDVDDLHRYMRTLDLGSTSKKNKRPTFFGEPVPFGVEPVFDYAKMERNLRRGEDDYESDEDSEDEED